MLKRQAKEVEVEQLINMTNLEILEDLRNSNLEKTILRKININIKSITTKKSTMKIKKKFITITI